MSEIDERGRGADDAEHVGVVLLVGGEHGDDDLDVVAVALGEERADRPVGQARGEDRVLGGAAFALDEAAGDLAGGVHALFVSTVSGKKSMPSRGGALAVAVARTTVSP